MSVRQHVATPKKTPAECIFTEFDIDESYLKKKKIGRNVTVLVKIRQI
jgi:hypothetical protein